MGLMVNLLVYVRYFMLCILTGSEYSTASSLRIPPSFRPLLLLLTRKDWEVTTYFLQWERNSRMFTQLCGIWYTRVKQSSVLLPLIGIRRVIHIYLVSIARRPDKESALAFTNIYSCSVWTFLGCRLVTNFEEGRMFTSLCAALRAVEDKTREEREWKPLRNLNKGNVSPTENVLGTGAHRRSLPKK